MVRYSGIFLALFLAGQTPALSLEPEEVGPLVREYLMQNPQVMIELLRNAQTHYDTAQRNQQRAIMETHAAELAREGLGSHIFSEGDIQLVEFFDYQCGFCKSVFPILTNIVREDGGVKLILKEFPVFGEVSHFAAKAAIAAEKQGRYFALHRALMENEGRLSEDRILALAQEVGLDTARLRADMEGEDIEQAIAANFALARALEVRATPGFVAGAEVIAQSLTREEFAALFAHLRAVKAR